MRSPFAIFRKHQRVLMVVTIGLALFAFVICSGASAMDPSTMPKPLLALAIICMCGGVAWVVGVPSKKSSETSVLGLIIGIALAFLMYRASGPALAVRAETGDISQEELNVLRDRRERANQFVLRAIYRTHEDEEGEIDQMQVRTLIPQYQFGGLVDGNPTSVRDIVTTELLRREAESLGLVVPETAVKDYVNALSDGKMTADLFRELRTDLALGEDELYGILAAEIQARLAAELLYDFDFEELSGLQPTLTPEQYWDFYRRIWMQQSAELAVVPVEDFVDESAEPPLEDLQRLFNENRGNYPNRTEDGELDEGRFGFMQPRKWEIAFLEVVFDDVQGTVESPSAAEIDEYYQANYVRPAEERAEEETPEAEREDDDLPVLEFGEATPDPDATGSSPADGEVPEAEAADAPAADEASDVPASADPAAAESEGPALPDGEEGLPESNAPPETGSAGRSVVPEGTQFVALQQVPDEATAAGAGDDTGDEPTASDESVTPDATGDDADPDATAESGEEPAVPETGGLDDGEASDPAPPDTAVPPLTEALREQIRSEILRDRTQEKMEGIALSAMQDFSDYSYRTSLPEENPQHLKAEELSAEVERYAEEQGLYYGTTPRMTFVELQESEEYPVGSAFVEGRGTVAETLLDSNPDDLYRADIAQGLETDSRFVFWKIADHPPEEPDSLDDEGVREQVEEAWRQEQARTSARRRAEELLVLIEAEENDLEAALAGQTTTGEAEGDALVVIPTGEFRWLSDPSAPSPDPFFYALFSSPQLRDPNGTTGVGPDFMETVFNELSPGEVGIAANVDRSEYYLVKILERTPWGEEEEEIFRQEFLKQPIFDSGFAAGYASVYQRLAMIETMRQRSSWVDELWEKHGAQLLEEPS